MTSAVEAGGMAFDRRVGCCRSPVKLAASGLMAGSAHNVSSTAGDHCCRRERFRIRVKFLGTSAFGP
jgi:hypothetical protein